MILANNHVSLQFSETGFGWQIFFLTELLLHRGVQSQKVGFVFYEKMYAVINQAAFFMRSILSFGVIMGSIVLHLGC